MTGLDSSVPHNRASEVMDLHPITLEGSHVRLEPLAHEHLDGSSMRSSTSAAWRVEFKTDVANEISRRALLRIGATEEGVLRSYTVTTAGDVRDSVFYSIVESEGPDVKLRLRQMLDRSYPSAV